MGIKDVIKKRKIGVTYGGISGGLALGLRFKFKDKKTSEELERLKIKLRDTRTKRLDLEWQIEHLAIVGSKKDAEKLWKLSRSRLYYLRKESRIDKLITKEEERLEK